MESHRDEALVEQAALMALARRHPEPGLLHHSDRGSQYTCQDYRACGGTHQSPQTRSVGKRMVKLSFLTCNTASRPSA